MKTHSAEIVFVLDRSGSMEAIKNDMIGGFKTFIDEQKKVPGECKVTLIQFDTEYEVVYAGKPLTEIPTLGLIPRGSTALLDAIGNAVSSTGERLAKMVEADRPEKVIVIIITDGQENASKEYNNARVLEMIKHQREVYRWDFVFLGADENALSVAQGLDIGMVAQWQGSSVGAAAVGVSVGSAVATSRSTGDAVNYSQSSYDSALNPKV